MRLKKKLDKGSEKVIVDSSTINRQANKFFRCFEEGNSRETGALVIFSVLRIYSS
jgi:hypothetical protein|tara:strand:- start:4 stop:168 length:165 start_codon:yes stop_codon:yes gene_type:complete